MLKQLSGKQILSEMQAFVDENPTLKGFCILMAVICYVSALVGAAAGAYVIIEHGPRWARLSMLALCVGTLLFLLSKFIGAVWEVDEWL
jgi:hypothetical protein